MFIYSGSQLSNLCSRASFSVSNLGWFVFKTLKPFNCFHFVFNCSKDEIVKWSLQSVFLKSKVVLPLFVFLPVHWYSTLSIQICFDTKRSAFSLKNQSRISCSSWDFWFCNCSYSLIISLAFFVLASFLTNSSKISFCLSYVFSVLFFSCFTFISISNFIQASFISLKEENSKGFPHHFLINCILFHTIPLNLHFTHPIETVLQAFAKNTASISFNDDISGCIVSSFEIFCI